MRPRVRHPPVLLAAALSAGCVCIPFDFTLAPDLEEDDPALKIPAIAEAAEGETLHELQALVDALEHPDEAVRLFAIEALRERTGADLGFRPFDPPDVREAAVDRWRRWLEEVEWVVRERRAAS